MQYAIHFSQHNNFVVALVCVKQVGIIADGKNCIVRTPKFLYV